MASSGSMGLSVLADIKAESEAKAKAKADRKAAKGKGGKAKPADPRYSADEFERLSANTGVTVAKDGTVLLRPANSGPRRGRAARLLVEATPEAIDALCESLKAILADEALMGEKRASFEAWQAKQG